MERFFEWAVVSVCGANSQCNLDLFNMIPIEGLWEFLMALQSEIGGVRAKLVLTDIIIMTIRDIFCYFTLRSHTLYLEQ